MNYEIWILARKKKKKINVDSKYTKKEKFQVFNAKVTLAKLSLLTKSRVFSFKKQH